MFSTSDQQPTQQHPRPFDATRAEATMKSSAAGAGTIMILSGAIGLAVALTAGGELADSRAAYAAGLAGILLAGVILVGVGVMRGLLAVLRHQVSIEHRLDDALHGAFQTLEEIQRHQTRSERHLATLWKRLDEVSRKQTQQDKVVGNVLEDDLRRRRTDHGG